MQQKGNSMKNTEEKTRLLGMAGQRILSEYERNGGEGFRQALSYPVRLGPGYTLYPKSVFYSEGMYFCIAGIEGEKKLCIFSREEVSSAFPGERIKAGNLHGVLADRNWESYQSVHPYLPFIKPVSLRNKRTSLGCGDRLGLASPGHIRACEGYDIHPVLAQQSIRELTLTDRTYKGVVSDAAFLTLQEGFTRGYGADGDHIKLMDDIKVAVAADMPMITLDLTEVMDPAPADWGQEKIDQEFERLNQDCRERVLEDYAGKTFNLEKSSLHISAEEAKRCALIYWKAIDFTQEVDSYLRQERGDAYDLEVSIDETTTPTIPSHHLFIAAELQRRNVTVNSLAPRFIGEFQKGIDYIGDLDTFEQQFVVHCEISKVYGNYKMSIHSGSDKFSVYPIIGKLTDMRVHVKTAGTSWLEAVHTISHVDTDLFRTMVAQAKNYIPEALKLYHITADFSKVPDPKELSDSELYRFLEEIESRQMLHICFGYLLFDPLIREKFFQTLADHEEYHYETVKQHMLRHITLLGTPTV